MKIGDGKVPSLVFDSTHHALLAEEALEERGFDIDIVPPPAGGTDCGLAIKILAADRRDAEALLKRRRVNFRVVAK